MRVTLPYITLYYILYIILYILPAGECVLDDVDGDAGEVDVGHDHDVELPEELRPSAALQILSCQIAPLQA